MRSVIEKNQRMEAKCDQFYQQLVSAVQEINAAAKKEENKKFDAQINTLACQILGASSMVDISWNKTLKDSSMREKAIAALDKEKQSLCNTILTRMSEDDADWNLALEQAVTGRYILTIKRNGMAALAGSALVKAATGEDSSDSELGSTEMHSEVTGLVEYLAENDAHGIEIARDLVKSLSWETKRFASSIETLNPNYKEDEILGLVSTDYQKPYDVRELMARLVDSSKFMEFKPKYGVATICIQAEIFGISCGIIGNNGPIDPNGATKAAQFVQLCDHANNPIVFLNNITGYMVGKESEHAGMIKRGSKMIQAVTNVTVPKISFYIGASFGAGNYGMCGYAFNPDFLFTWPNAKTGVMGGQQAASTMEQVMLNAAKRRGKKLEPKKLKKQLDVLKEQFDSQSDAFLTSGRLLDHGMIDPRDTRKVIGFCLNTCLEARKRNLKSNTFGIARM